MPGRVRTRRQFAQFSTPSAKGRSGPLRVSFVADPETGVNVAFAISRKAGSAVVRNRVRRRLRTLFDTEITGIDQGMYLVRVDGPAKELTYEELHTHLHESLRRAGVV